MAYDIEKRGYGTIAYRDSVKVIVAELTEHFFRFCSQQLSHKEQMRFQNSVGYENRDRFADPESVDHKESFYIKAGYEFPLSFFPSKEDLSFVESCKRLLKEVLPLVQGSTKVLSELAGTDLARYFDESSFTLRAIHYYPDAKLEIAHHHVDRGGQTYHLYETTDGLEVYWNGSWNKMEFSKGEMAYFPCMQAQYASHCALKGLCHRVVSNDDSVRSGRYSLVLFVEYNKLPYKYSMRKAGPIEKAFAPGQNYAMSFDDMEGYFEERA